MPGGYNCCHHLPAAAAELRKISVRSGESRVEADMVKSKVDQALGKFERCLLARSVFLCSVGAAGGGELILRDRRT